MKVLELPRIRIYPSTGEDRRLILLELEALTRNLHFAGSRRYPALLRYVVEKTLNGQTDELKERTLGIEVFQRPPDYDTNNDTVVRVTAGEVRKRLALTYHESEESHAVQILLPAGSYVPEFYRMAAALDAEAAPGVSLPPETSRDTPKEALAPPAAGQAYRLHNLSEDSGMFAAQPASGSGFRRRFPAVLLIAAVGALAGAGIVAGRTEFRSSPADRFWQPMRSPTAPVLFCAGALVPTNTGFTEASRDDDYPYISMATTEALTSIGRQMARDRLEFVVQAASASSLTDLRLHPTVLVGAYDNRWTILLLNELRYRFAAKPRIAIYDSSNPAKIWKRPDALLYKDEEDYAIVARFHNRVTDNMLVVIAGLGKNGTEAAAQFATTSRYLDLIAGASHRDWASKNIEVVLRVPVVDSKTGAPSIEAVDVW